jgi:CheY-like chemotaxis protein
MPHIDGLEAARRIRALPGGDQPLIVALTGWGQRADRERTQAAGFDVHLVKPADPEEIAGLIVRGREKREVRPS